MTRRELLALSASAGVTIAAAANIDVFFEDILARRMRMHPEVATMARFFSGEEQNVLDGKLSDVSDAGHHARTAFARDALRHHARASL